ncbi:MAG TPA: hypothetical protein VM821_01965, partial [Abditibacteriaceae bacterium]|nr:hypothetical protein [Abditibacteriaceae bacterium]
IYIRLVVRPERASVVQTKLAPRLVSILETHGIKKGAGAEVEIFDAPAPLSSAVLPDTHLASEFKNDDPAT